MNGSSERGAGGGGGERRVGECFYQWNANSVRTRIRRQTVMAADFPSASDYIETGRVEVGN